jgi:hypothetical protein
LLFCIQISDHHNASLVEKLKVFGVDKFGITGVTKRTTWLTIIDFEIIFVVIIDNHLSSWIHPNWFLDISSNSGIDHVPINDIKHL